MQHFKVKEEFKMKSVYVPGCFDVLHSGHLNLLSVAANFGRVIVGLETDETVISYKQIVMMPYTERLAVLRSLKQVTEIIPQDGTDHRKNIATIKPDYVVHGDDWKTGRWAGHRQEIIDLLKEWGGELIEPEYTQGISSTLIKRRVSKSFKEEKK
jgi:phosphoenolpyruvate phosphomutase / 2-hydroxyethylphosphonate cytidylyltransferase